MAKINQLKAGVILSYMSTGLNMAIQLLYTPIMLRILGQSEYGLYTLVGSVVSYLSLFSLGFTASYLRFYSRYESQRDRKSIARLNGMFLTIFTLMALAAFTCGMILSAFPQQIFGNKLKIEELEKAQFLMRILVINIALTFPAGLFDSMISAHEQFVFQRLLSLLGVLFNPLIALPLLLRGYGSVALVCVTMAITITKLIVSAVYCMMKLGVRFSFFGFDIALIREIAGFSAFIFLGMIVDQVNWTVDKFVLGRVSGTKAVAVYGVGAQINSLFLGFATTISTVFVPRVNNIAAANKADMKEKLTELLIKVGRIQCLVLGLISSGFMIFGKYFIVNIYSTAEYADAYAVALLLILPGMISLIQNLGIEIQRALNKHQFMACIYCIMAIVNVAISIPLASEFGPIGSAFGTAICVIITNGVLMNIYYQRSIGINILLFWKSMKSMIGGFLIPGIFGAVIFKFVIHSSLLEYFSMIAIYCCIYCGSMWKLGMNSEERCLFLKPIKNRFVGKSK